MKAMILFTLIYLCAFIATYSQPNASSRKIKYYHAWIYQGNEDPAIKGFLYELKDSSVVILISIQNSINKFDTSYLLEFPVNKIEMIKTRKKGSLGTGIIAGGLSGFALGGLIGLLLNEIPENDYKVKDNMEYRNSAFSMGIYIGLLGIGIGTIAGTVKMSYEINNNWNDYMRNAGTLIKKSYKYQLQN
jgi:hypothetical protein